MRADFYQRVRGELDGIAEAGLLKTERVITSAQGPEIAVRIQPGAVLNLCANNYLGLANDPRVVEGANAATRRWGAGLASVRFICGTQELHKELESEIAGYLGFDDAILFAAAFDANGGVFEPLLGEADAIISDTLNHASIIDGVRLCKAQRLRFAASDMEDLERALMEARAGGARTVMIATDGVFSMDGSIANLPAICDLADRYEALVLVDDCHATGFLGAQGRGSPAFRAVEGRVDILTGTFGKALGGAMGGFVAARSEVIELLRQRARPYLFSNALAPAVCGASLAAIEIARSAEGDDLRARLRQNAVTFRSGLQDAGFDLLPGEHPIIPVMLHDAAKAQEFASRLLAEGVYVSGFFYPVVPHGQARIRTQMSAALTPGHIETALNAFTRVGQEMKVIP